MADDLHCLLERLDLRGVTLVAHSMGGLQIVRYYSRNGHSGRVSKLVFMGSPDCLRKAPDKGAPHGLMFSLRDRINEDLADFIHAVLNGNPTA